MSIYKSQTIETLLKKCTYMISGPLLLEFLILLILKQLETPQTSYQPKINNIIRNTNKIKRLKKKTNPNQENKNTKIKEAEFSSISN